MIERTRLTGSARPTIEQLLDTELQDFDQVMAEVRSGIRDARHYNDLEERATGIAQGMTNAFRKGRVG